MNERLCAFCSNDKFTMQDTEKGIFAVCVQCGATVVIMQRRAHPGRHGETAWELMTESANNPDGTMRW